MRLRAVVAAVGVAVIAIYAALMSLDSLVFYPLAAAPGQSLGEIHTQLTRYGMSVAVDTVFVVVVAAIGLVLAIGAAVVGLRTKMDAPMFGLLFLGLLVCGGIATFVTGVFVGMDIADSYAPSDSARTIWPGVLFVTSAAALVSIPLVAASRARWQKCPAAAD